MAQTITIANIKIDLKASGGEYTRKELRDLQSILRESESPADKFHEKMKLLDKTLRDGSISAEQFAKAEEALAKKFGVLTYGMEQAANEAKKLAEAEKQVADAAKLAAMDKAAKDAQLLAEADKKAAEAARKLADEEANLARMITASMTPTQKMRQDVQALDKAFTQGKIDVNAYNQAIDHLAKKHGLEAVYANSAAEAERKKAEADRVATQTARDLAKATEDANRKLEEAARAKKEYAAAAMSRQQLASEIPDPMKGWGDIAMKVRGVRGLSGALTGMAVASAAIAATKGIADFSKSAVSVSMMREQVQAQMEVLTGSAEAAKKLINATIELDQKSALSASQFQDSSKVLLGYGLSVREVMPALNKLSEISMGNNEKMQSLTLAFGQVRANGRLMGQEVLQMVNAGFNPLQEISRTTGESMVSLRKRMEDGKVSFEEVAKAMDTATSAGGRFYGMNDKMAGTTAVKIAKLQTHWQNLLAVEGAKMQPGINRALDLINGNIDQMPKRGEAITGWWMNLTGKANDYNEQLNEANRIKRLTEELDKKAVAAEELKAKLAKDRAAAEKAASDAQDAAVKADDQRIQSERSSFESRIKQISEDRMKAKFGGDENAFNKAMLFNDTFQMTDAEKIQAQAALMDMDETRRLNELNAAQSAIDAANKELAIQKRVAEMKDNNFLASDSLRKEYAQLDEMFKRQMQQAGDNEKQKEGIRQRAAIAERSIMERSQFEKQQQQQQKEQPNIGELVAKNIAPAIRSGTVEAYQFMARQNADLQEKAETKRIQQSILEESRKANEFNRNAPRIQLARN
jgi:tape measure domain-containing protein